MKIINFLNNEKETSQELVRVNKEQTDVIEGAEFIRTDARTDIMKREHLSVPIVSYKK